MDKLIDVFLVVTVVWMLKDLFVPQKNIKRTNHSRPLKNEKENSEKTGFSMKSISFKNLIVKDNGNKTSVLPVGTLEVITKDGTSYVPVPFNNQGQFMIGSAEDCDLVLRSPYIGSYHCYIEYDEDNDEIVLVDNDSRNGIYNIFKNRVDEIVLDKGTDFYLAKCIHLRWNDFNPFLQIAEEDLPVVEMSNQKGNKSQENLFSGTKVISANR